MKKISKKLKVFIAILFLISSVCLYSLFKDCGILPKDANYSIVLGNSLYKLTSNGLVENGWFYDYSGTSQCHYNSFINGKRGMLYFDRAFGYCSWMENKNTGIYRLDLNKLFMELDCILKTQYSVHVLSVSSCGILMLFRVSGGSDIYLLDLESQKQKKVVDDYSFVYGVSWLNNHQFVYCSSNLNNDKKRPLYLYDIKTDTKTDMKLDDFYPGAVTPDGKELMLAGNGKTILYDIENRSIKIFANKEMRITNMIWLPDGKGFLYSDRKFSDLFDAMELYYGLYYYSLEKKRSIRLMKLYDLSTKRGFIVPSSINIKLPDTSRNRDIATGKRKNIHLVKICSW